MLTKEQLNSLIDEIMQAYNALLFKSLTWVKTFDDVLGRRYMESEISKSNYLYNIHEDLKRIEELTTLYHNTKSIHPIQDYIKTMKDVLQSKTYLDVIYDLVIGLHCVLEVLGYYLKNEKENNI